MGSVQRVFVVGAAVAMAGFFSGCPRSSVPCDPASCSAGCCDESGHCVTGTATIACGAAGSACQDCRTLLGDCANQSCVNPQTDGGVLDAGPSFVPCAAAAYVAAHQVLSLGTGETGAYYPPCVVVHVGDTVTWAFNAPGVDFSIHPLAPSSRGTKPNPVPPVSAGLDASVVFPVAGYFPFWCTTHGTDHGDGMAGVIQVLP